MFRPMISPNSLAAFSASVTSSLTVARANAVVQVREQAPVAPQASGPQTRQPGALVLQPRQGAPSPQPGQALPRGSLLDLSV